MIEEAENTISIPALLQDKIHKKLTLTKEGLTIEKPLSSALVVFIPAEDILSFRYGIKWLKGSHFTIGRRYTIQVQDVNNQITSIKLSSYYGIRRKAYGQVWSEIIDRLWDNYFINTYNFYSGLYQARQEFELAGMKFYHNGIGWDNNSLFWNEIGLSTYQTYFMVHHRNDPKKTKSFSFMNDWNAYLLQRLLKKIIGEISPVVK